MLNAHTLEGLKRKDTLSAIVKIKKIAEFRVLAVWS